MATKQAENGRVEMLLEKIWQVLDHQLAVNHAVLAELKQQGKERETLAKLMISWQLYGSNCIIAHEQADCQVASEAITRGRVEETHDSKHH